MKRHAHEREASNASQDEPAAVGQMPARKALTYVLAATALAYANALGGDFVYDDLKQILANEQIRSWGNLLHAFTSSVWSFQEGARTTDLTPPYYRPLFTVYLTFGYKLFGHWPQGWHVLSVIVHAGATACVYKLLARLSRRHFVAVVGALVFGLHPAHVESVAWISGIPDPLMACFFAPALLWYDRFRAGDGRKYLFYSLAAFAAAVFTKETALALPVVVLAWELFVKRGDAFAARLKTAALVLAPYAAVAGLYLAARVAVLGRLGAAHPLNASVPDQLIWMTVPYAVVSYLANLLYPFWLSIVYGTSFVRGAGDVKFWLPTLIFAALTVAGFVLRRRLSGEARLAAVLLFAPLLPVLNLKLFHPEHIVQDRYLYLSVVGFGWLVGLGIVSLRAGERTKLALVLLVALILGGGTIAGNRVWSSEVALWARAARHAPDFWSVRYNLGKAHLGRRQYAEARRELGRAAELKRGSRIHNELALAQAGLGDRDGALRSVQTALEIEPTLVEARTNLGTLLFERGQYREAARQFAAALQLDPRQTEARFNLARASAQVGDHQLAAREYEAVLARNPGDREARAGLAESYAALGRHGDAAEQNRLAGDVND